MIQGIFMTTGMTGGCFVLLELCKYRAASTEGLDAAKLFGGGSGHGPLWPMEIAQSIVQRAPRDWMLRSCSEVGAGTARFGVSIAAEMVMVRAQHRGAARG